MTLSFIFGCNDVAAWPQTALGFTGPLWDGEEEEDGPAEALPAANARVQGEGGNGHAFSLPAFPPCVSLPLLAVPLRLQRTVAISDVGLRAGHAAAGCLQGRSSAVAGLEPGGTCGNAQQRNTALALLCHSCPFVVAKGCFFPCQCGTLCLAVRLRYSRSPTSDRCLGLAWSLQRPWFVHFWPDGRFWKQDPRRKANLTSTFGACRVPAVLRCLLFCLRFCSALFFLSVCVLLPQGGSVRSVGLRAMQLALSMPPRVTRCPTVLGRTTSPSLSLSFTLLSFSRSLRRDWADGVPAHPVRSMVVGRGGRRRRRRRRLLLPADAALGRLAGRDLRVPQRRCVLACSAKASHLNE
eukprot:SAG22_NODE_136_length_18095_cov_19.897255_25_plen_352_part_00